MVSNLSNLVDAGLCHPSRCDGVHTDAAVVMKAFDPDLGERVEWWFTRMDSVPEQCFLCNQGVCIQRVVKYTDGGCVAVHLRATDLN